MIWIVVGIIVVCQFCTAMSLLSHKNRIEILEGQILLSQKDIEHLRNKGDY